MQLQILIVLNYCFALKSLTKLRLISESGIALQSVQLQSIILIIIFLKCPLLVLKSQ